MTLSRFNAHRRAALALLLAGGLSAALPALAADAAAAKAVVDAAKARGEVGEQGDGYLGLVVASAPAEVRAAVAEINAGRAAVYRDTAAKTGVTPEAAGQATARQLIERLPEGQSYKPLNGGWTRK
jgi:uncharacterized protein YdbL (DUF1318 family)